MTGASPRVVKRRWRFYTTARGASPVAEFLDELSDDEAVHVAAAMKDVRKNGLPAAKHLRGDIYEVIADGPNRSFRVLFAGEGSHGQVLLAVVAFSKKTQKAPPRMLTLANERLIDWRRRGRKTR
jgi:phage-related protein